MDSIWIMLIYLGLYLIVCTIFGSISKIISIGKGYDGGFAWGFFLGIIGIIVAALRPHAYRPEKEVIYINNNQVSNDSEDDEEEYADSEEVALMFQGQKMSWICEHCNATNDETNEYCIECGNRKPKEWFCMNCGEKM